MYEKNFKILEQIWERNRIDKEDSDSSYFMSLLYTGELITKLICAGLLAGVEEDSRKQKYTLKYNLVRADGIGDWSKGIEEILTGPTSHLLSIFLSSEQKQLTQKSKSGSWQHESLVCINNCLQKIGENVDEIPVKSAGKNWFNLFSRLRNKTRGHGALPVNLQSEICPDLEKSLLLISNNFSLFDFEWAHLSQNLSGKYRVSSISYNSTSFNYLKSEEGKKENFENGIYIYLNRPVLVDLVKTDSDLSDFYFPNGGFNSKRYEVISYSTGNRDSKDNSKFLLPPGDLPSSETEGGKTLEVLDNCFTNLPQVQSIYIERPQLEKELGDVLMNERHPMVTLLGRGGIGKTTLALRVLTNLCKEERFQSILWFSSRDIDLLEYGVKSVQPQILTIDDIANEFAHLIIPAKASEKGFDSRKFFEDQLQSTNQPTSPFLIVFDNFETVKNPSEVFIWLDTFIRTPNKILITSRISEFKADYPINVSGMTESEYYELAAIVGEELGITHLINKDYLEKLYEESSGHPYVVKILLGIVSVEKKAGNINRIVASQEELLTALFERTFGMLSTAAKKVFLTLSSWRSTIPQIGLEAVLTKTADSTIDVNAAIEELYKFSFIDIVSSPKDGSKFISLPLSAFLFGKNKLAVSTFKHQIFKDRDLLMMFGVGKFIEVENGVETRLEKFFRNVAINVTTKNHNKLTFYKPILEFICRKHYPSWLTYSSLMEEFKNYSEAIYALQQFIPKENDANKRIAIWKRLSILYKSNEDYFGEIHALIEMCEIETTSDASVSFTGTRMIQLLSEGKFNTTEEEKETVVGRLILIIEEKLSINPDNLDSKTKLAWLYVHINQIKKAKGLVKSILEVNPDYIYAAKLANTLRMKETYAEKKEN